jgi:hypothetical protein
MQSFHRSRGRILFEVFCALAIAESCVGAWMQTGAWAFLPAAAVAALYGIVHAFDMFGRTSTVAAAPQPVKAATARRSDVQMSEPTPAAPAPAELPLTAEHTKEPEKAEPAAQAPRARRAKSAPKASRGRTKAREEKVAEPVSSEETGVIESTPSVETEMPELVPPREAQVVKLTPPEVAQPPAPAAADEASPVPLTPLFEPQPFVRQQRGMFGRKAG